ncbi:phosphatidylglycerophosphatase A family protein [Nevskia soli]|jgi:phosphatidylglycerophosphatase A|uniref:phosphatidylglycerophosphatase A family protein n=1 Tax=Nevskia soli TaxID=418856 RepID=UPI0015D6D130|nr:phosphatidylglycerophosphatase A [Nevskia soli]
MRVNVATSVATWFGTGLSPVAPGTAGSIAALVPAILAARTLGWSGRDIGACGVALFLPAVWAADVAAKQAGLKDPGFIVVDEVVGQCVTLFGASKLNWQTWACAFVLFRAFDIWKPFPIRRLEHLPGGWGIVADDAAAGVYAALVLCFIGWLQSRFTV